MSGTGHLGKSLTPKSGGLRQPATSISWWGETMKSRRSFFLGGITVLLTLVTLSGCGGGSGGGGGSPAPPPSTPTFSLSLNSTSIAIVQGSTQTLAIQVIAQNGFSGSVSITATGLPAGLSVSPVPLVISAGSSGNLSLAAASDAALGSVQVTLAAVSGAITVDDSLAVAVKAPPPFVLLGGSPVAAFYDKSRQLLFATNPFLNELDVLGADLSVRTRLMVPAPFGIDQMPDGKTLVVGTMTQGIYTIDEDTLAVTQHLSPNFTDLLQTTTLLEEPAAMANGKVLIIGTDQGMEEGNRHLIEWDSNTNNFTQVTLPTPSSALENILTRLKRSADHQWAILTGDEVYLYNSNSDSFSSAPLPDTIGGVEDVAANPNGTQFAAISPEVVTFYDQGLNVVGTVSTKIGTFDYNNARYSTDGSRLYWELLYALDVIDTSKFIELGNVTTEYGASPQAGAILLWVDDSQRAFLSANGGIGIKDCITLRTAAPSDDDPNTVYPFPTAIPLNTSTPVQFNNGNTPAGTTITFGGVPGTVQNYSLTTVLPPPSSVAGPVDTVFTVPDGEAYLMPQGFAYGVDVVTATATLLPPIGTPTIALFGFGMLNEPWGAPTVTVGGQTSSQVTVNTDLDSPLKAIFVQLPGGSSDSALITVTSKNGTGTLENAMTYIPSATIVPASGLLQLLYDQRRNLVYALKATEIDVLNPLTLQWQTPLRPGGLGGSGYDSMTLTPDGSKMLVVDASANTLTIFNPDNPAQSTVAPLPAMGPYGIVVTSTGKAFIASSAVAGQSPIEFDLSTLTYSSLFNSGFYYLSQFRGTPDGTHVVSVVNDSSGKVSVWNSANDTFTSQGFVLGYWTDVAISPDGSIIAPVEGGPGFAGVAAGFFDEQLHFINNTVYPDLSPPSGGQVLGTIFSPSGQTLVVPLGDSIEFFNVATGRLRGRLMTPEPLPAFSYPIMGQRDIAPDPTGQTIFAISASGLTVMKLPVPVDQLTPPSSIFSYGPVASPILSRTAGSHGKSLMLRKSLPRRRETASQ